MAQGKRPAPSTGSRKGEEIEVTRTPRPRGKGEARNFRGGIRGGAATIREKRKIKTSANFLIGEGGPETTFERRKWHVQKEEKEGGTKTATGSLDLSRRGATAPRSVPGRAQLTGDVDYVTDGGEERGKCNLDYFVLGSAKHNVA